MLSPNVNRMRLKFRSEYSSGREPLQKPNKETELREYVLFDE